MSKIFISYAREDRQIAERVYGDLKSVGGDCWIDLHDLMPGQDWSETIRAAIRRSNFFVAILSGRSMTKRGFVQKEIRIALDVLDEMPPDNIYLIPCRADDSDIPYERIAKLHWIDLFANYDNGIDKLRQATNLRSRKPLSFDSFREIHKLLDENIVKYKLERMRKIAADAAKMNVPTWSTELRLQISRSLRRLNEAIVRLHADLPLYNWKVEELGGGRFLLHFRHDQEQENFQEELRSRLHVEGIRILEGKSYRNAIPKGRSIAVLGDEPGELSIRTPEGRVVGFVNGPNGPDKQVGGTFDIETGKRLEEQDLQEALRNSTFKVIRAPNGLSYPSSRDSQEKLAPIAVWYDENGNLVTFGVPAEDPT